MMHVIDLGCLLFRRSETNLQIKDPCKNAFLGAEKNNVVLARYTFFLDGGGGCGGGGVDDWKFTLYR